MSIKNLALNSIAKSTHLTATEMTQSFVEFVNTKPQMDEQISQVEHYAVMLCDALYLDKKNAIIGWHLDAIKTLESVEDSDHIHGGDIAYHNKQVQEIYNNGIDTEFFIQSGRKYHKIVMRSHQSNSVHCFIDKVTGDVYKSASWTAPAKGIRYNLLDEQSRENCYRCCDWSGAYLYSR